MVPVRTEYSNITYKAEGCNDLPATIVKDPDGTEGVETVWELTDEELEQINKDRRVYLYVTGRQVPPLLMATKSEIVC